MKQHHIINMLRVTAIALLMMTGMSAMAQTERQTTSADSIDIMMARIDSLTRTDSVVTLEEDPVQSVLIDSTRIAKPKRDWNTWRPNPKRALWLAWYCPVQDRYTIASTGNFLSSMEGSSGVSMPSHGII